MTTVQKSILINATREQIRPLYFDAAKVKARDENIIRFEPDADWPAVGAHFETEFKTVAFNVEAVATCLSYDPQTMHLVYEMKSPNNEPSHWEWSFDEQNGATTVSVQVDYTLPGSYLGQVLDKLFVERQNAKQTEQSLAGLKAQVEEAL